MKVKQTIHWEKVSFSLWQLNNGNIRVITENEIDILRHTDFF